MQNLPMFSTQSGIASLTLTEIPYTKKAYVTIQDASDIVALLRECVDFCRAVGAETVYASGKQLPDSFNLHTEIWEMRRLKSGFPDTDAALFPVQESTLNTWKTIYNENIEKTPGAAHFSDADCRRMIKNGNGYFVHKGDTLLGIGIALGNKIDGIVAIVPGSGQDVLLALIHALSGEEVVLEVASTNKRAIRLYERLGFIKTGEITKWYQIYPLSSKST